MEFRVDISTGPLEILSSTPTLLAELGGGVNYVASVVHSWLKVTEKPDSETKISGAEFWLRYNHYPFMIKRTINEEIIILLLQQVKIGD